jgi:hypothetical protein
MPTKKPTPIKKTTTAKKSATKIVGPSKAQMDRWEIESAMSTLQRATEIQKDSKLMGQVKKMAAEKARDLGEIAKGKS